MRLFCVGNKGFEKNLSRKWLSYEKWPNFEYFQVWRRSWDEHDIEMRTKFNMYEEEVLTTLLYLSETWTTISPYSKLLEPFWTIKSHKCECISLNCAIFFPFFLISIFIMYCFFFFWIPFDSFSLFSVPFTAVWLQNETISLKIDFLRIGLFIAYTDLLH